jgi:hypothetical protein
MTSWASTLGMLPGKVLSSDTIDPYEIDIAQAKTMQIDIPLVVQGRDVMKELDEMRDVLMLLNRDVDMEAKYPKLKEIKDEYEAQLAKYTTFDILKDSK